MSRLRVLFTCLGMAISVIAEPSVAAEPPPNVIIVLADDLGYGDLGCFGAQNIRTPRIDGLAANGLRFTNFLVSQPVCTASRASLLSASLKTTLAKLGALRLTANPSVPS